MALRTFSPTRTKATWKPRVSDDDILFLKSADNTLTILGVSGTETAQCKEGGRTPLIELPYASFPDQTAEGYAQASYMNELPQGIQLDYRILGGFNANSLEISWQETDMPFGETSLEWIALKTFTGFQLKYLTPQKRSPLMFAFADEDAYVYCDESPCLECIFMCKRGFVLYVSIREYGIVRIPLERASAHWETR